MQDSWDQLQFGLRLGKNPKQVITTTPRPLNLLRKIKSDVNTYVTDGSTLDNADNLAEPFLKAILDKYGDTRFGRQEIQGELLEDIPGALWTRDSIDRNRRREVPAELQRIIVAVDPATSSDEKSDETGIICVGLARDEDGYNRGYVLADRSLRGSPDEWAKQAVALYREFEADRIVAEKNQGGEMVEAVIRAVDRNVPVTLVHATRGKLVRAEPISALYEQNRVHHVGRFDQLEDQMCVFTSDFDRGDNGSPDRMDALVWGLAFLFERMTGRRRSKGKTEASDGYNLKDVTAAQNNVYRGESDTSWMGM
jgi:phage terminase large subunit-like protein